MKKKIGIRVSRATVNQGQHKVITSNAVLVKIKKL